MSVNGVQSADIKPSSMDKSVDQKHYRLQTSRGRASEPSSAWRPRRKQGEEASTPEEKVSGDDFKFSELEPNKEKTLDDSDALKGTQKLAKKLIDFEQSKIFKDLKGFLPLSAILLAFFAITDKKASGKEKASGVGMALPLLFFPKIYRDLVLPLLKKIIPDKKDKTSFNPDTDMVFPNAEFKEVLFNGISRFLGTSDPKRIELDLSKFKQKSPTMLFVGPPGVGKTEIAGFVANKMGRELKLITSEKTSKWIGETENNLISAFSEAKKKNQLLFFDEADTFCTQRADSSAHGSLRHDNNVVNTLLKLIDESGVPVILATNSGNIDTAIKSRMKVTIAFPAATPEQNYSIMLSEFGKMKMREDRLSEFEKNKDALIKVFSGFEFSPRDVLKIIEAAVGRVDFRVARAERAGADALAKVDRSISVEDIKAEAARLKGNLEQASRSQMGSRSLFAF